MEARSHVCGESRLQDADRLAAVRVAHQTLADARPALTRMVRLLAQLTETPIAAVSLVDEDRQHILAATGFDVAETTEDEGPFCRHCIEAADLFVVDDARADDRFTGCPTVLGPPALRFYAGLPIRSPHGLLIGTVCAVDTVPRELTPEQELALRDIRASVEDLVTLRSLLAHDPLTGLYNRVCLDDLLQREVRRAARDVQPLALLMIDVDAFKEFNDLYGHPAGDGCIAAVGSAIESQLGRGGDFAARYGGDEFVAVLAGTDEPGAANVAESIRRAVATLGIPHAGSPTGRVTLTLGVASAAPGAMPPAEELIHAADRALYEAKRAGRNTVRSDGPNGGSRSGSKGDARNGRSHRTTGPADHRGRPEGAEESSPRHGQDVASP